MLVALLPLAGTGTISVTMDSVLLGSMRPMGKNHGVSES